MKRKLLDQRLTRAFLEVAKRIREVFAEQLEPARLADRLPTGQDHDQPIDADPFAGGRRETVLERLDVIRIGPTALGEAGRLLVSVVQLGIRISELHPANEILEPLDDSLESVFGYLVEG